MAAYMEAVHWRRNIFLVPSGAEGKEFVLETTRMLEAYAESSDLESFALTAAMTMPLLLLQKPHGASNTRDHIACLRRRLTAWKSGDVDGLMRECRAIQEHLRKNTTHVNAKKEDSALRGFTKLMLLGNIRGALRVLSQTHSGGVLSLSEQIEANGGKRTVLDILKEKHPQMPAEANEEALADITSAAALPFHPVLFEKITGASIRSAALRTEGSAGPSGIDAKGWRRMSTAFHGASTSLCNALAALTRRLCSHHVDPTPLHALIACRLIPLDKKPGVRPIGVCETARRIMGKAIVNVLHQDIRVAAAPLQLCAGQPAGSEAGVYALANVFSSLDSEAVLLVDASNAFNQLNRQQALRNIPVLCPPLACLVTNIYRAAAPLFVGGEVIYSREGTTQGDPLAMAIFAIAVRPLIDRLTAAKAIQVWFADDAASGGKLVAIRLWWDMLVRYGPLFGYYVNVSKSWLLVKTAKLQDATTIFAGTGLNVTTSGVQHLGAPLGDDSFRASFVAEKVNNWKDELTRLAEIAAVQPHLAFCALTQGLVNKWTYLSRTTDNISESLKPLEDVLHQTVLPSLIGRPPPGQDTRSLFGLPSRLGGLGIRDPSEKGAEHHTTSKTVTRPIVQVLLEQHDGDPQDRLQEALAEQRGAIAQAKRQQAAEDKERQRIVVERLSPPLRAAVELATDDGASSWLSARPIDEHGFALHKGAFRDAIALRYGWEPADLPSHCACGEPFDSCHALTCSKGGFTIVRHNEIRDLTAQLLSEVCSDVEVEPRLQPLSGEQFHRLSANRDPEARLDVKARGFWGGTFECAFFDVRVFNPRARSNAAMPTIAAVYRRHEQAKRRAYEQRVRDVEMATFTPLVFSASGGFGPSALVTFKRIASRLSGAWSMPYSAVMGWLRCRVSFALLRSAVMCIRGSRQHVRGRLGCPMLAIAEGRF